MKRLFAASILLLAGVSSSFGYIRLMTTAPAPLAPLSRPDASGIQFYINNQLVSGFQSSASGKNVTVIANGADPVGATRAALATWNASGAGIKFLPLQTTTLGINSTDNKMVIALATASQDISYVGSAIAITNSQYVTGSGTYAGFQVVNGSIVDSDILINPGYSFSTDGSGSNAGVNSTTQDFQAVMTHELGHSLGADHTNLMGATMFQYVALTDRYPSVDEMTFVKAAYPAASGTGFGAISGSITLSGAPLAYAMLAMIDTTQKLTLGGLTAADGTYSVQVPPGNYVVYAEPYNSIVQPGNLYLSLTSAQATAASGFETTFNGGPTTTVSVTAGGTANVSFAVNAGTATLTPPLYGFGATGKTGDVFTFTTIGNSVPVASGQTVDFVFVGPSFPTSLNLALSNITVLGGGVTATNLTKDTSTLTLNNVKYPEWRLTLQIAATATATPASILITTGSTVLSMSALLVVTPPTPLFTSASLVSAASYAGPAGKGGVSPGGMYSIYAGQVNGTLAPYLGPATAVLNRGYDAYSTLPADLSGVSVTFDGVKAPLFFVAGSQINLQVPFETAAKIGSTTSVVVNFNGAISAPIAVPVAATQPAFFDYTATGTDSYVINNKDGKNNSASDPAAVGDYVLVYGTGIGVTALGAAGYGLQTGVAAPAPPANYNYGNVANCTIGSVTEKAGFVGWAYSFVGLAQWNIQIPAGVTGKLTLTCTDIATGNTTPPGTVYVK